MRCRPLVIPFLGFRAMIARCGHQFHLRASRSSRRRSPGNRTARFDSSCHVQSAAAESSSSPTSDSGENLSCGRSNDSASFSDSSTLPPPATLLALVAPTAAFVPATTRPRTRCVTIVGRAVGHAVDAGGTAAIRRAGRGGSRDVGDIDWLIAAGGGGGHDGC